MWLWLLFSFIFLLVISKKWLRMRVCWNMEWWGMRIMGTLLAATRGDLGTQLRWRPCLVLEKLSSMSLAFTLVPIYILSSSTFYFNCFFFFLLFFFIAIRLKYGGNLQLVLNLLLGLFKKKKSDIYIYIYIYRRGTRVFVADRNPNIFLC